MLTVQALLEVDLRTFSGICHALSAEETAQCLRAVTLLAASIMSGLNGLPPTAQRGTPPPGGPTLPLRVLSEGGSALVVLALDGRAASVPLSLPQSGPPPPGCAAGGAVLCALDPLQLCWEEDRAPWGRIGTDNCT